MDLFRQHELFEIEVLEKMHCLKLLDPLVFGGGTMLRLCHELNRYSADLDFWIIKEIDQNKYFSSLNKHLGAYYELTDSQIKHHTLLLELRASAYPRRLKIEIRREIKEIDFQQKIAFSRFAAKQVVLKALTLEQAMQNKVSAFINRGEIRDGHDIEFLLRKGIAIPPMKQTEITRFRNRLEQLKDIDFKVKLGSILERDVRDYYATHKFIFLKEKLAVQQNK